MSTTNGVNIEFNNCITNQINGLEKSKKLNNKENKFLITQMSIQVILFILFVSGIFSNSLFHFSNLAFIAVSWFVCGTITILRGINNKVDINTIREHKNTQEKCKDEFNIEDVVFYKVTPLRRYAFWGSTLALMLFSIIYISLVLSKYKNKYLVILPLLLLFANIIIYIILLTEKKNFNNPETST